MPDFGGGHPDPNLVHAKELMSLVFPNSEIAKQSAADKSKPRAPTKQKVLVFCFILRVIKS